MPIKKSELYSSIWQSCDELRGGMDASQYKDYVLVLLFIKYVSDRYAGQPYAPIVIPPDGSFADMVALKGDKEIGDKVKVIKRFSKEYFDLVRRNPTVLNKVMARQQSGQALVIEAAEPAADEAEASEPSLYRIE